MINNCELNGNMRVEWIDSFRGVLFFCVMICHCQIAPENLRYFYNPFFLPGFFFISGYLYKEKKTTVSLKNILNGLLFPYLLFYFILSLIPISKALFGLDESSVISLVKRSLNDILLAGDALWFIPCLIIIEIYYLIIRKLCLNETVMILFVFLSFFFMFFFTSDKKEHLPWNIETASYVLGYYILGIIYKKYDLKISKLINIRYLSILLLLIYAILCITIYSLLGDMVDLHMNYFKYPLVYIVFSLFGIFSMMCFCRDYLCFSYFINLGKYTFFAFAFHPLIFHLINRAFSFLGINIISNSYCVTFLYCFVTGGILTLIAKRIELVCPILVGKKNNAIFYVDKSK